MKKLTVILFLISLTMAGSSLAQTILSNGTGGGLWSSGSTWEGGNVPTSGSDVIIQGTDSVLFAGGDGCTNLTVASGGKLAASAGPFTVSGVFTLESDATYYNNITEAGTVPGAIRDLNTTSTVVHNGSGTIGGEGNLEFGNLIIQKSSGCTAGGNLIIHGNLTINDVTNQYFRGVSLTSGSQYHIIEGNVYVIRGTWSGIDVGGSPQDVCVWDVYGDVFVYGSGLAATGTQYDARLSAFSSASSMGTSIFNIRGNLTIDGGRFQGGASSTVGTGTGIFNLHKNFTVSPNSSFGTSTHGGPFAVNFVGNGTQRVTIGRNLSMGYMLTDTIAAGANVIFDNADSSWGSTIATSVVQVNGSLEMVNNSKLTGAGNFILAPGGTLKIGSAVGISTADTGNVRMTGGRTFSPEANYEYKGTTAQVLGDALPSTVAGLAVNNPNSIVLDRELTVNNSLQIINGDLDLNGHTLTLGSNGTLTESADNTVKGNGKLTITTDVNAPSNVNVGRLGAIITSGSNLGSTTVERYHSAVSGNANQSISRYYNIIPANNSALNATLRLNYNDGELNGLTEANLVMYKSLTGANDTWTQMGGTVNTVQNYVELAGINELSYWTLAASDRPLPVVETTNALPANYAMHQNFPNPFNPTTTIRFELPEASFVNITIYNSLGQKVSEAVNEFMNSGYYQRSFSAENLASGIYIYKLTASAKSGIHSFSGKMILMK